MSKTYTREELITIIQQLSENFDLFHSIFSEKIRETQNTDEDPEEILSSIDDSFFSLQSSVVSTSRNIKYDCKMPKQPPHTFSRGYFCQDDANHKFCRSHSLTSCVICGGNLK